MEFSIQKINFGRKKAYIPIRFREKGYTHTRERKTNNKWRASIMRTIETELDPLIAPVHFFFPLSFFIRYLTTTPCKLSSCIPFFTQLWPQSPSQRHFSPGPAQSVPGSQAATHFKLGCRLVRSQFDWPGKNIERHHKSALKCQFNNVLEQVTGFVPRSLFHIYTFLSLRFGFSDMWSRLPRPCFAQRWSPLNVSRFHCKGNWTNKLF